MKDLALDLEELRRSAMLNADVKRLGELLAPELYYRHSTGVLDTRDSFLEKLSSGVLRYRSLNLSLTGHCASTGALAVHGEMKAQILGEGGSIREISAFYLALWMFRGMWQLVAFQGLAANTASGLHVLP